MTEPTSRACRDCAHLHREQESWEMPHIQWWECDARPVMANLRSFPFKRTTCRSWQARERERSLSEVLRHAD